MDVSFEQRLLRFLAREEEGERKSANDLRSLPPAERVLEGECITDAVLEEIDGGKFAFSARENLSKFRPGDPVVVGDGLDFARGASLVYGSYSARRRVLVLERDPYARGDLPALDVGASYVVDRRPLGLRGRLQEVVRTGFADELVAGVLTGAHEPGRDEGRYERALQRLADTCLNPAQIEAAAAAIATESLCLVQGPPGTGKTRMLAEVLKALCSAGCRIALTAFTHRAVDNVLLAVRALDAELPLVKAGNPGASAKLLRQRGVRLVDPRRGQLPAGGVVVAGTCFAFAKLPAGERFHYTVFDEAGQLPIPHAIAGMLRSRHWVFVGDHHQLPPVITVEHADREVTTSVFEHLNAHYGSLLLDTSYRMNDGVCAVVSDVFYGGRLRPAAEVEARRMPFVPGGEHDDLLDPERPVVLAHVDHRQPGTRSPEEAALVAELVDEVVARHGVAPAEVCIVAPFRSQVRAVRSALDERGVAWSVDDLAIDTIERIQGQEREVVIISLAVGDPDSLARRASFFFSTNRLNVALSRARTKAVLVASPGAFRALPIDPASLAAAAVFKRLERRLEPIAVAPRARDAAAP